MKTKRYTIVLTEGASTVVAKICRAFGISLADVFRNGLLLLRIYLQAVQDDKQVILTDKKGKKEAVIEIPFLSKKRLESESKGPSADRPQKEH